MKKTIQTIVYFSTVLLLLSVPANCLAQPYGKGLYNANVPYGGQTSLSISTNGNIDIPITPSNGGTLATNQSTITVTSTDVMGYKLYIRSLSDTNMNNLGSLLPASANVSATTLANDTWGYNTDATSNFIGMTLNDALIKSISTPAASGDITNVTYGIKVDFAKPAGKYTTSVVYTAVPQTN